MNSRKFQLKITVIGPGTVGTTLAAVLHRSGHRIVSVIGRTKQQAIRCGKRVLCKSNSSDLHTISPSTDLIIIAVSDQTIATVAESLADLSMLDWTHLKVCHVSGAMSSDLLTPLKQKGAGVFSLHPIQSFPRTRLLKDQITAMQGITYGVEGDRPMIAFARKLAGSIGGKVLVVPKEKKILYHLACVFASNYPVALLGALEEQLKAIPGSRVQPFLSLMESSIQNSIGMGAVNALTGPIVRGSINTITGHLEELENQELRELYLAIAKYSVSMLKRQNKLSFEQLDALNKLFNK
jgi:predicted short-subunit dehydrogenase-like oxidoreductase (DUF2520 family)